MSDVPASFRSHDYLITPDGHLKKQFRASNIPASKVWLTRMKAIEAREIAAMYEPLEPPKPPEPKPPKPVMPERKALLRTPSQHDDYCSRVAYFIRQGKSYSEAMDIVLDGGAA